MQVIAIVSRCGVGLSMLCDDSKRHANRKRRDLNMCGPPHLVVLHKRCRSSWFVLHSRRGSTRLGVEEDVFQMR